MSESEILPEIEFWSPSEAKWTRVGTYLDMMHALENLRMMQGATTGSRYRLNPEAVPNGWYYDQGMDEWSKL